MANPVLLMKGSLVRAVSQQAPHVSLLESCVYAPSNFVPMSEHQEAPSSFFDAASDIDHGGCLFSQLWTN